MPTKLESNLQIVLPLQKKRIKMNHPPKYISKVKISKLWDRFDIEWNLHPDVNILAGGNGSGKSTILDCIYAAIDGSKTSKYLHDIFQITDISFDNRKHILLKPIESTLIQEGEVFSIQGQDLVNNINIDIISTFDQPLQNAESINKLSENKVRTELDWEIYRLQKQYLDYQLNISKQKDKIIENSPNNFKEEYAKLKEPQDNFLRIIDELFGETQKKINRGKNEIEFILNNTIQITPYQLSSGEKQLLVILLKVLVQDKKQSILFMDEPEISLHIEWQKKLIAYIRTLNPNVQIIVATHSPALIMDGWMDKVFNVSDLITKKYN